MTTREVEGLALVGLGLVTIAITRWPESRLSRIILAVPFGRPPPSTPTVRYARYVIGAAVVAFGAWIATGH